MEAKLELLNTYISEWEYEIEEIWIQYWFPSESIESFIQNLAIFIFVGYGWYTLLYKRMVEQGQPLFNLNGDISNLMFMTLIVSSPLLPKPFIVIVGCMLMYPTGGDLIMSCMLINLPIYKDETEIVQDVCFPLKYYELLNRFDQNLIVKTLVSSYEYKLQQLYLLDPILFNKLYDIIVLINTVDPNNIYGIM